MVLNLVLGYAGEGSETGMRKVAGMPYVYQRGDQYLVRVQVPAAAQGALGKTELKKSLGGDLSIVKRNHHRVVAVTGPHRVVQLDC